MPKSGWRQLKGLPKGARRRAFLAMGLSFALVAFCTGAVIDGHGRVAAYTALAAFGVYLCVCALYLGLRGVVSARRRR